MAVERYGRSTDGRASIVSLQLPVLASAIVLTDVYRCRADWETRHGASLGLRAILKLQGGSGGQLGASLLVQYQRILLTSFIFHICSGTNH